MPAISARDAIRQTAYAMRARVDVSRCLARPRPLIVHTAPKSGSTSVEAALAAAGQDTLKVHFRRANLDAALNRYAKRKVPVPYHFHLSRALNAREAQGQLPRLRVVAMIRDPVARMVSSLFQSPEFWQIDGLPADEVAARAVRLVEKAAQKGTVFRWVEQELVAGYGVDLAGFDRATGHATYRGRHADVLLLKTEAIDRAADALSAFVGRRVAPGHRNVRDDTADAARYRAARGAVKLPAATLDRIYGSPAMQIFYAAPEIAGFRRRWCA